MRERWLNARPANAPLRSRLGLGVTFVHFYVAHPPRGVLNRFWGKWCQMKLQMKREALAKIDRKANDKGSSGTGEAW